MHVGEMPEPTPRHLEWRYEGIPPGSSVDGWICGFTVGVYTHYNGERTLPCVSRFTKGELTCSACEKLDPRYVLYFPVITHPNHERRVIQVSKTVSRRVMDLAHASPVRLAMPKKLRMPLTPILIDASLLNERHRQHIARTPPEDIRRYLTQKLWKMPHLTRYWGVAEWTDPPK